MATAAATTTPASYLFDPAQHSHLLPYLAALHNRCISHDDMIATFLPPIDQTALLDWWRARTAEVAAGSRIIVIFLNETEPGSRAKGTELDGLVMLDMPKTQTGPFRGSVEKLLVHPRYRRQGAARAMMARLEEEAQQRGRTLLLLEAETGTPSEEVYRKLGYVEIGKVPEYGISPRNGERISGTFFYKNLLT